jgi:hypothetical protein
MIQETYNNNNMVDDELPLPDDDEPSPAVHQIIQTTKEEGPAILTTQEQELELIGASVDDEESSSFLVSSFLVMVAPSSEDENENENNGHRVLRKKKKSNKNDQIKVALLHVTYKVGYELLDYVLKEPAIQRSAGGSKILLNGKVPSATAKTIFLWTILSVTICAGACCCLMLFVNHGLFLENEEANAPPPRPVRRRLTHEQVRANYPAFLFCQETHQVDDDCAICLDEFATGSRCRQLPCQHVFHSTCIGRWLIERSATCPLCKIDLYEEEEEESDDDDGSAEASEPPPATTQSLFSTWLWAPRSTTTTTTTGSETTVVVATTDSNGVVSTTTTVQPPPGDSTPSWWTLLTLPSYNRIAPAEESNDNTTTEESRRRRRPWSNWFGRPQRRLNEGGMLTELTEPLMAGENNSLEEVAFAPDEETPSGTPPLNPVLQPAPLETQPQPPQPSSTPTEQQPLQEDTTPQSTTQAEV